MLKFLSLATFGRSLRLFRIVFGTIWLIDGLLEWQPADFNNFAQLVAAASDGQPAPLALLIRAGHAVIAVSPFFANGALATVETLLGLALITNRFTRPALWISAVLAAGIWIFGEGFGMVFMPGATDIQAGPLYVLLSLMLLQALQLTREAQRPAPVRIPARIP